MGIALFLLVAVIVFMVWSYSYRQTPIQEKTEPKPEPKFEDQFEYYDAYLPEVIEEDLEERACGIMLEDCKIAVEYYKIEDPKKVKYYEYCVQLCEEKLAKLRSEQSTNTEQTTA